MNLDTNRIDLSELTKEVPGITWAIGTAMIEACLVCFEDQGHVSGVALEVHGTYSGILTVTWGIAVTDSMRRSWNDKPFTTEFAAYGIAILLAQHITEYTVVERAERGLGFDYWLGSYDPSRMPTVQHEARLEISGIRHGSNKRVAARIVQKKKQTDTPDSVEPTYIVVVDFGKPLSWVVKK